MKKLITVAALCLTAMGSMAQSKNVDPKVFWKEDFKKSKLPAGWINVDVSKQGGEWICTNQPYPGSYQYQQQAPPIASKSRGYHLQYQAGYIVDEDQPRWEKKNQYPDAYIQSPAIDCSKKSSVVLKFQHTFRWNNYKAAKDAGLFVGVSTDSLHWTDINVMNNIPPATDMFNPINQELNISKLAANKPKVYLRWYWKGYFSWYWMVDDIELAESYNNDISIARLTSHNEEANVFKKADVIKVLVKNTGSQDIKTNFTVDCNIDGNRTITANVNASKNPIKAGTEREVIFEATDLTNRPTHTFEFLTNLANDENKANNRLRIKVNAVETLLGNLNKFDAADNEFTFSSGPSKVKVIFYKDDIFRIWLASDGEFNNPAGNDIVVSYAVKNPHVKWSDEGTYYKLQTNACVVRAYKAPLRFAMYDKTNTNAIWEESKQLSFGARTVQTMKRHADEYFYGGGMQNGYFSHRDKEILIEKGGGWDDGGRANPAPFYMSTAGYGAFRNTFDAGKYAFKDTLKFSHNENRFDCFYFYGPSLKSILGGYTEITGRPFLMPRWALSMGDANCYNKLDRNKKPQTTPAVISTVADKYIEHNMPRGWILPNDGYGCGYVKLDSVVKELGKRGFKTGLWTENGVEKIATEVGQFGTRLCKLDVAWVGPGYKYALDGCKAAYEGIENNSNERGYVWSVMGWAGTQRYSTVWSGDQSGNWEYIRFHIPTVIGSGLSAQNAATGDIDGIFGGSDSTYVRDLQWKCFTPVLMTMSGWAKKDKQPWVYGEPFTSINRKYLQLKMRLTPYMYSYCNEAYETGVPASRAMVLEFPNDPVTKGKQTQYQFMNGEWLLVAPVYKKESKRDSIYLPEGKWYDYWTGDEYKGGTWLNGFAAPLEKLPLFVKNGAIIPMYPQMNYDGEKLADTLTLDLYPAEKTSFELYEDDGLSREHRKGAFAKTLITLEGGKTVKVAINAAKGDYKGKYLQRLYALNVHSSSAPAKVLLNGKAIKAYKTAAAFAKASTGYFFDQQDRKGTVQVKTGSLSTATAQGVELQY